MNAVQPIPALTAPARALTVANPMQAVLHRTYGTPDVLTVEEIERPVPGEHDVLIRVHAANVSIGDHHVVTGTPYLIRLTPYGGLPGPRNRVPGAAMAGRVVALGDKVTTLRIGDDVFGQAAHGAFAEYLVMPAAPGRAPKPINLSFEEAAAVPWGATALVGLRAAGLKAGQRILINGASGGVGTWAVQIAKSLGAHVTAVCSTRNVALVRGLGADEVLDYCAHDFVTGGARFDVMLDLVGNRSLSDCRSVLTPRGVYVPCSGGGGDWFGPLLRSFGGLLMSLFTSQKLKMFVMTPNRDNLMFLKDLVERGQARPIIERTFALSEVTRALEHVGEGHARGQTVIRISCRCRARSEPGMFAGHLGSGIDERTEA